MGGKERIRDALRRARLLTPVVDEALEKRVHIVCGDISQPNLGISSDLWNSLATRVQAIIHNAALVNYVQNYDTLKPHNVDGTRELLRFACTGTKKEFHFISSTIIFGWTLKAELLESENNQDMSNLDFGYAQSKWVAEQLVFAAEKQGLKTAIYRPSFISASTTGIASQDDIIIRLLAFMINYGLAVNTRNQISFLPADIVADNIAAIFRKRPMVGGTLHVTADSYYNLSDITQLIASKYGYPFVYYDIPQFVAELTRLCASSDPLYPLLHFIHQSHLKIAAMQHKRYDNSRYREARRLAANDYVDPSLEETVSYMMEYMLGERIIS
jgi:thioester reductase-like protein